MKKNAFCFLLILLLLLVSCSKQQPLIVQENIEPVEETSIEIIEEEHPNQQAVQQFIEFTISNQQIKLNIDQIPIISNYLEQHVDKNKAIQNMQLTQMLADEFDSLFLLSFACQANSCSYILLNTELMHSQLLADQAQIIKIEPSPNLAHVLINFQRRLPSKAWDTNKLVVFDLENWSEVILTENQLDLISLHAFRWPILDVNWLSDTELTIHLPAIDKPTTSHLSDWYHTEKKLEKEIIVSVE